MDTKNNAKIPTEWIRYLLLQSSHDYLLDFSRSISCKGENELVEWLMNEVKGYVNTQIVKKIHLQLNDRYFLSSLKRQVEHNRDFSKWMYDEEINNEYFVKLTGRKIDNQ